MRGARPLSGRSVLYGRRRGPRLRPRRRELVAELLPKLTIAPPADGRIDDPLALFPPASRGGLWLEIGFGAGEHLAWQAAAHPGVAFIGCEAFVNGIARLLTTIEAQGLTNIRLFPDDARALLPGLPDRALDRVFVLFPDPWPKRRHHKRRLIDRAFVDALARVMNDGAELRIATDHRGYCRWMLACLLPHRAFAWTAQRREDWSRRRADWPLTRYEAKALAAGAECVYLRFVRRPRPHRS
jgi:tRNA (guanine-N7-)-methyltransferase